MMLSACECETSFASCHEVGASDLVFIGTVQSIEPIFMNRWYMANQSPMRSLNDAYAEAQQHPSAAALARLKDAYLNIFPGLAPDEKRRLQGAGTIHDVASLFYSALDRGMRVRLKVRTLFKHQERRRRCQEKGTGFLRCLDHVRQLRFRLSNRRDLPCVCE
jgi:hypothetical protein